MENEIVHVWRSGGKEKIAKKKVKVAGNFEE